MTYVIHLSVPHTDTDSEESALEWYVGPYTTQHEAKIAASAVDPYYSPRVLTMNGVSALADFTSS